MEKENILQKIIIMLQSKSTSLKMRTIFYFGLIITFGIILRLYYTPYDLPIVTDGFYSFVYATETIFQNGLPIGYTTTSTGWSNFLSLIFAFSDTSEPIQLMQIQRTTSIIISTITAIPIFFILKKFVRSDIALYGSLLFVIEPRLLLISVDGINFSLYMFLFVSSIALFLNKNNVGFFLSFVSIALATLVRFEGLLLIIPLSIMYFMKIRDKKSILKFLGMFFIFIMIISSVGNLRIEATDGICVEYIHGVRCGDDGFSQDILGGFEFIYRYILVGEYHREFLDDSSNETDRKVYLTFREFQNENDEPTKPVIMEAINESLSRFGFFLGLSIIPFFIFFIFFNIVTRVKDGKIFHYSFNSKIIFIFSGIMLLPALFAYMRGIDEVRYVLILIPLFCLISISFNQSLSLKIFSNRKILFSLIIIPLILSITFIEYNKRDYNYEMEAFKISQEIVSRTDITNNFHKSGYVKTASLIQDWPELPEPNPTNGKIKHEFTKIPTNNVNSLESLIENSRNKKLEYLIIDNQSKLFDDFNYNEKEFFYLERLNSESLEQIKNYEIFKINYNKFDERLDNQN